METVDLGAMAEEMLASLQKMEPHRRVEVLIQPRVLVTGDMELLWVAMQNLVENAWKFTSQTPVARIEFGTTREDGKQVCYLRDNGIGFDMTYADKLFKPFQRLHNDSEFPGTGVGLSIVHRIISRHKGHIWIDIAENRGTTCYFTLPPVEAPARGDEP